MSKNEIFDLIQVVGTLLVMWSGKYLNKAKKVMDEFDGLKSKITTLENSQKAAWKEIDKLKIPHGGEI